MWNKFNADTLSMMIYSGWVNGHLLMNRLQEGMDQDIYDAVKTNITEYLEDDMKYKLYNDGIYFISINARRLEIYTLINNEIETLIGVLNDKGNH